MNASPHDAGLDRLERATASLDPPFAVVDLDAFWANAADMERRAAPKPIRLASKSVRCRALQERVLALPGFAGTLAFTLPEALWLAGHGFRDIVVAYPTADRRALRELALLTAEPADTRVSIMVDDVAHLDLLDLATHGLTDLRPPCASASSSTPASGYWAGACASAPSDPPSTALSRPPPSPTPSSPALGCGSWA